MTPNHDAMDDMAAWSAQHRATVMLGCAGNCRQGRDNCDCWPKAAEACTEIGADTAPRFGLIERLRRWWRVAKLKATVVGCEHELAELQGRIEELQSLTFPATATLSTQAMAQAQIRTLHYGVMRAGAEKEAAEAEIARLQKGGAL